MFSSQHDDEACDERAPKFLLRVSSVGSVAQRAAVSPATGRSGLTHFLCKNTMFGVSVALDAAAGAAASLQGAALRAALILDTDAKSLADAAPVTFPGKSELLKVPSISIARDGASAALSVRIQVLSSQFSDMFFRVRVTARLADGTELLAHSPPIAVLSKPYLCLGKRPSSGTSGAAKAAGGKRKASSASVALTADSQSSLLAQLRQLSDEQARQRALLEQLLAGTALHSSQPASSHSQSGSPPTSSAVSSDNYLDGDDDDDDDTGSSVAPLPLLRNQPPRRRRVQARRAARPASFRSRSTSSFATSSDDESDEERPVPQLPPALAFPPQHAAAAAEDLPPALHTNNKKPKLADEPQPADAEQALRDAADALAHAFALAGGAKCEDSVLALRRALPQTLLDALNIDVLPSTPTTQSAATAAAKSSSLALFDSSAPIDDVSKCGPACELFLGNCPHNNSHNAAAIVTDSASAQHQLGGLSVSEQLSMFGW